MRAAPSSLWSARDTSSTTAAPDHLPVASDAVTDSGLRATTSTDESGRGWPRAGPRRREPVTAADIGGGVAFLALVFPFLSAVMFWDIVARWARHGRGILR